MFVSSTKNIRPIFHSYLLSLRCLSWERLLWSIEWNELKFSVKHCAVHFNHFTARKRKDWSGFQHIYKQWNIKGTCQTRELFHSAVFTSFHICSTGLRSRLSGPLKKSPMFSNQPIFGAFSSLPLRSDDLWVRLSLLLDSTGCFAPGCLDSLETSLCLA